jgi:hypothetical protein
MDKKGGNISLGVLDLLRTLETDKMKYMSDTIFCSSASVPYEINHVPDYVGWREIFQFNIKNVTRLEKGFGFVMWGLKFTDRGGQCPLTSSGRRTEGQSHVQSYKNCIPVSLVVGKKRLACAVQLAAYKWQSQMPNFVKIGASTGRRKGSLTSIQTGSASTSLS